MKNYLRWMKFIISILIVFGTSFATAAVWCGMSVTTDVVLDRNLYCESGGVGYALKVESDNINIDLNGYRIHGDDAGIGIEVNDVIGLKLIGNGGSISHFESAVDFNDVSDSLIEDVMFYKNQVSSITNKTIASNSTGNQYNKNVFIYGEYGLRLINTPGLNNKYHKIVNNEFYKVNINIRLQYATENAVLNNFIWKAQRAGIVLVESDYNLIEGNQILDSSSNAIEISNSSFNKIKGNTFDGGVFGMFLVSVEFDGGCTSTDVSEFNEINSNYFFNYDYGVYLRPFSCGEVRFNQVNGNKIYDDEVGIYLSREVQNNDLRGNGFAGTVEPVFDLSDGSNVY